jgi:hypothetical protein
LAGGSISGSIWRDYCCHISHMMRELWLDCESFQFSCPAEEEEEETVAAIVATERYVCYWGRDHHLCCCCCFCYNGVGLSTSGCN